MTNLNHHLLAVLIAMLLVCIPLAAISVGCIILAILVQLV